MPGNCVPARGGGEQPEARRAVRNEGKAHPMSLDMTKTVEPSLFKYGEGCQGWTLANPVQNGRGHNDHWSSYRHGGVGGRGMRVQVVDVREEISGVGPQGPTAGTSGQTARPVRAPEKSERSIVATKAVTRLERRGRARLTRTAKQRTGRWFHPWK
jgi:hypothetical protein